MLMRFSCERQGQVPVKGGLYLGAGDFPKNEMAGGWEERGEIDLNILIKHSQPIITSLALSLSVPHISEQEGLTQADTRA